jgi:hypothetical protein
MTQSIDLIASSVFELNDVELLTSSTKALNQTLSPYSVSLICEISEICGCVLLIGAAGGATFGGEGNRCQTERAFFCIW